MFFATINHNYDRKQPTMKRKNTHIRQKKNDQSQIITFWTSWNKLLFPKRSAKMIDGSEKCKCQLAFELQNSCVYEKHGK